MPTTIRETETQQVIETQLVSVTEAGILLRGKAVWKWQADARRFAFRLDSFPQQTELVPTTIRETETQQVVQTEVVSLTEASIPAKAPTGFESSR